MRRREELNHSGHDSFLDIVANLVGILVILIMVVGVQAKEAWQTSGSEAEPPEAVEQPAPKETAPVAAEPVAAEPVAAEPVVAEPPPELPDVATPRREAESLRNDSWRLDAQRQQLEMETESRRVVRGELQFQVALAEKTLEERRHTLSERERQRLDEANLVQALVDQLQGLQFDLKKAEEVEAKPVILEHRPTPLAKTVFGQERNFRLAQGRIAYVPIDEFVTRLRAEAKRKTWKLENARQTTEIMGPIHGFQMQYNLERVERVIRSPNGPVQRSMVNLAGFVLLPVRDGLGEPLGVALGTDSEFQQRMAAYDPEETTITIWTYPDSFDEFRQVKEYLWKRGFVTAARPLPEGYPIGGSPDGSRSVSQ